MPLEAPTYELLDDLTIVQEFIGNTMTVCTCTSKSTGLMVLYSLREFDSFYRSHVSTPKGVPTTVDPLAAPQSASKQRNKPTRRKKDEATDRVPRVKRSLFGMPLDDPKDQSKGG